MIRYYLLLFVFFLSLTSLQAFNFEVNIQNYNDQKVFLSIFNGNQLTILYEGTTDKNGLVVFSDEKKLDEGMYVLSLDGKENIELLINEQQKIQLFIKYPELLKEANCYGNTVLDKFFEYNRAFNKLQEEEYFIKRGILQNFSDRDTVLFLRKQLAEQDEITLGFLQSVINSNPNILGYYVKGMVVLKDNVFKQDNLSGVFDSLANVKPYLHHFPYSSKLVNDYIRSLSETPLSNIVYRTDSLIQWTKEAPDLYRFILTELYNGLNVNSVPVTEMLFYHLSTNYYLANKVDWVDESFKNTLKESMDDISNIVIGQSFINLAKALNDRNKFTYASEKAVYKIIAFVDNDCSTCSNDLKKLQLRTDYDMAEASVFIYDMDENLGTERLQLLHPEWNIENVAVYHTFIEQALNLSQVPTYFVLNEDNTLIAKGNTIDAVLELSKPDNFL